MGPDPGDQSQRLVPHHPPRAARHEEARLRPHHPDRLGACAGRLAVQERLRRRQARHRRAHQDGGAGRRGVRRHRQCHLPRLRADAAGRKADSGAGQGARHQRGSGHQGRAARGAADQALRHRRRGRRPRRLPGRRSGWLHHRRASSRSTAAGPRTEATRKRIHFHARRRRPRPRLHAACRAKLPQGSLPLRRPRIHGHQLRDRSRHHPRAVAGTAGADRPAGRALRVHPHAGQFGLRQIHRVPAWSSRACSTARR